MSRPANDLTGRELNAMLVPRVEELAYLIFPNARKIGNFLCVGSIDGEPGQKFKVKLRGNKAGSWVDYGTSESDPNGKGDLIKLVTLTLGGGDYAKGFAEVRRFLNLDTMDPQAFARRKDAAKKAMDRANAKALADDEKRARNAAGMWSHAAELTGASPPVLYLQSRGIDFGALGKLPGAIRYRHRLKHAEIGREIPAMVTAFVTLEGRHVATHQTFLALTPKGWGKVPRMMIEGKEEDVAKKIFGPAWAFGAHIPLWKGEQKGKLADIAPGTPVYVSEGIEDGLSYAMSDPAARVIAAGTLGMIGQVRLPRQAGDLIILAQNDVKKRPIEQLEAAIRTQQHRNRKQGIERVVRCKRPPVGVNDWNDWLRELTGIA